MSKIGNPLTLKGAERVGRTTSEAVIKFGQPMVQWISEQTGDDKAWLGAYIMAEVFGMLMGYMLLEEDDEEAVERAHRDLLSHIEKTLDRVRSRMSAFILTVESGGDPDRVICDRCGASLRTFGERCNAPIEERCAGIDTVERLQREAKIKLKAAGGAAREKIKKVVGR